MTARRALDTLATYVVLGLIVKGSVAEAPSPRSGASTSIQAGAH